MGFFNKLTTFLLSPQKYSLRWLVLFQTAWLLLPSAAVRANRMASPVFEGAGGTQDTGGSSVLYPASSCTKKTGSAPTSITIFLYIYFGSYAASITMTTACPNYQTYAEAVWLSRQHLKKWSAEGGPGLNSLNQIAEFSSFNEEIEWKQSRISRLRYPTATLVSCSKKKVTS